MALTVFSGDPDIYASFDTSRPTAANHSFASAGSGDEVLRISHLSPHFCAAAPCTLYIGVLGYTNASFSLLATQRRAPITRLVAGQPQHAHLDATEWAYYRLTLPADATGFRISLPATSGDPDFFVQAACPATCPTLPTAPPRLCATAPLPAIANQRMPSQLCNGPRERGATPNPNPNQGELPRAEQLLLQQGLVEEAMEMYQERHSSSSS